MAYTIFYSNIFESNVFEIEYYYRTHEGDTRADKVLKSIVHIIDRIQESPEQFPLESRYSYLGSRKAVVHNTFIIYFNIISENQIMIQDIIHSKINI